MEVTYMTSLVWRSMGSWVSLSMWKRTSNDDSVNALQDCATQIKILFEHSQIRWLIGFSKSF